MNEREKMTLMDDSSLVGPEGITLYKMDAQAHRLPFIPKTKTFPFLRQLLTMEYTQVLVCIYLQ